VTTKYTLLAGRCIVRWGTPLATLHGVGDYNPVELDTLARDIVRWGNLQEPMPTPATSLENIAHALTRIADAIEQEQERDHAQRMDHQPANR
jgi:hypothetical protein